MSENIKKLIVDVLQQHLKALLFPLFNNSMPCTCSTRVAQYLNTHILSVLCLNIDPIYHLILDLFDKERQSETET